MSYFPFFIDIEDKKILIVGGGDVAFRKAQKLMEFGAKIEIVAKDICENFNKLDVSLTKREFLDRDIENTFCVIAATNDKQLNEHIYRLCKAENIPINTVDDKDKCSFIFPAISKKGDITAAVSTNGKSPYAASFLRSEIDDILTDRKVFAVEALGENREKIQSKFPNKKERNNAISSIFDICLNNDKPKAKEKILKILKEDEK
ncbi:MAG: bifunctional precorrin-2 dehydrogenase/sirohydrochlorin ferrochelatase [Ruminococcus sp.]|nr:bifunctional precorrin-2 dehydrogenase/sirohydrochlorin ferrochelatase [Ruminococcus sp.]